MEARRVQTDLSTLRSWSFITSHAQVLLAVARNPDASIAKIAEAAEITERTTYRVLADLQQAGYVRRSRHGRQNRYEINRALPLRDATVGHGLVGDLLKLVVEEEVEGTAWYRGAPDALHERADVCRNCQALNSQSGCH